MDNVDNNRDGGGGSGGEGHPPENCGKTANDKLGTVREETNGAKLDGMKARADMLIALEKNVLSKNQSRTTRMASLSDGRMSNNTGTSNDEARSSNENDTEARPEGMKAASDMLAVFEKDVLRKNQSRTTPKASLSRGGTSENNMHPEKVSAEDTNVTEAISPADATSGLQDDTVTTGDHGDALSGEDQERLQDMKAAAALVIVADEAVSWSRESQSTTIDTTSFTENAESETMHESASSSSPAGPSSGGSSSQDTPSGHMQSQDMPDADVESGVPAQPGVLARPMAPQDETHLPGAHAVAGPDPPDVIVDLTSTDEELGEEHLVIQAEAHVVDEDAERDRLHQEIISSAPRAAILDATWKDLSPRILWAMALMFTLVVLALGLGIGLSTRPAKAIIAYNDMCDNALPVQKLPFVYKGTIEENSTTIESEALDCSLVESSDIGNWFQVRGTPDMCIRATVQQSDANVSLSVYEGDCNDLNCLHESRNTPGSTVFWKSKQRSYYLLVSEDSGSIGQYELNILGYKCIENDACDTASDIGLLPFSGSGSTSTATPETAAALQCSNSPVGVTRGVFYSIQGSGSCMTASTAGSDFNTTLAVYEGPCSEMVCKAQELVGSSIAEKGSRIGWSSQTGVEYKLLVAGHDGAVGNYSLIVQENECDKCPGAIVIGDLPFSDTGDTAFAADVEVVPGQSSCRLIRDGYKGVWYTMKTSSHCTSISTERSDFDFDTLIALYEGAGCESLSCIAENDDKLSCQESCKGSGITWTPPAAGTTYWILVTGKLGQTGRYGLDVSEKLCDRCQDAISVGALPYASSHNNAFADFVESKAVEECSVIKSDNRGVWYKLRNLGSGACIMASTIGSELDTVLAVYDIETTFESGGCEALKCLNSNNNLPPSPDRDESDAKMSQVFWRGEASGTESRPKDYYVFVGGAASLVGSYNLSISEYACLENDDCENALFAESLPYFYTGTTVNATPDHRSGALQCSVVQQTTRGVWHEFVGTGTCVSISLGSNFNDMISVYGGDCGSLRCVDYDMNRITEVKSKLTWNTEEGTRYKVFVGGFEDIVGAYNLSIAECTGKSECLVASEISSLPYYESDSLSNSSLTATEFRRAEMCDRFYWFGSYSYGYWYTVVGTGSCITVSTAASNHDLDTVIAVYEGGCNDLVCVTDNDDGPVDWTSDASWLSTVGTTYTVLIAGLDTEYGPLVVNVTEYSCLPDDDCVGATIVDVVPFSDAGSTIGATPEILSDSGCLLTDSDDHPEFFASNSSLRRDETRGVWYGVDGGLGPCFNVSVTSSSFPVLAAIYEGECGSLSCQGRALGGFVWNSTGDEANYKILVAAPAGLIGEFNLTLTAC